MSLTSCLKSAGNLLAPEHRAAIISRAKALRGEGVAKDDAARQAVSERIQAVEEMLRNSPQPVAQAKGPAGRIDAPQARELTPVQAQVLTPSKRETELGRLLDESTDPKVRADLTKQIETERTQREIRARGEEYLRLADGTSDPELRTQLERKAGDLGVRRRLPEPEVRELPVEAKVTEPVEVDMDAWRREHALGADDAQRAEKVADAFLIDPERVTFFALQFDNQPRAFDRAIQSILEDGERDASKSQGAAEGSQRPEPETRRVQRQEAGGRRDQESRGEQRQEARTSVPEAAGSAEDVGTVYRGRAEAAKARREAGNTYRVQKTAGGFVLRRATDKEIEAADRAGRRLSRGWRVNPEADSLLTAIAKLGGISMAEKVDTITEGNRNIGGRMLFRNTGDPLDRLASEQLAEYGYIPADEIDRDGGVSWLREAIRAEFNGQRTHYSQNGTDWMSEIQRRQEMAQDVYGDLPSGALDASGYNDEPSSVTDVIDLKVSGVSDLQSLREEAARRTEGESQDAYEQELNRLINAELAAIDAEASDADATSARDEDLGEPASQERPGPAEADAEPDYSLQRAPRVQAGRSDADADRDAQSDRARANLERAVRADLRAIEASRARSGAPVRLEIVEPDEVSAGLPNALASAFKAPIFFVRDAQGFSGFNAVTTNGRIYIHADADAPAVALTMHEVGHNLPADIRNDMVREVLSTVGPEQRARFMREFPGYQNKDGASVDEEIAMRIIEQDAQNPAFWDSLARRMGDTRFGELAKLILDNIDRIIAGFRKQDSSEFTNDIRKVRKAVGDAYMLALARQDLGGSDLQFAARRGPIPPETREANFRRWSNDAPLITSAEATRHKFVNGEKVVVEAFHGTKRPDRVGDKFLRKRATSGPMSFFTSDPALASTYALGKNDTSLSREDASYANWFKVKVPGQRTPTTIDRAWYALTPEQKAKISALAPRVRFGDEQGPDGGDVIDLGPEDHKVGTGSYDYQLDATKRQFDRTGNPLVALTEDWLNSGNLFGDEARFMQVLKLAGFPMGQVEFDSPHAEYPSVYKTFIAMQKPLVTSDLPGDVILALQEAAKRDRSKAQAAGADMWDKNTRTLRDWVKELTQPTGGSAEYVWTSIPDKVTEVFKSLGYDGIIDWSGKGGGDIKAPVYIPFGETQVKSAIGNKGTFSGDSKSILASERRRPDVSPIGFYSELTRRAEAGPGKGTAQAWKDYFKGQQSKGVKADEIEWSGINEWLDLQQGSVTRDQVVEYLRGNGVQVTESVLGGKEVEPDLRVTNRQMTEGEWDEDAQEMVDGGMEELTIEDRDSGDDFVVTIDRDAGNVSVQGPGGQFIDVDAPMNRQDEEDAKEAIGRWLRDRARAGSPMGVSGPSKYESYVVPGGTNYREVLLTLPERPLAEREENIGFNADGSEIIGSPDGTRRTREGYRSSHWDQPNILAHLRVDDRTDADGKRVLFVNEIQSDWGQEGKKKGFAKPEAADYAIEVKLVGSWHPQFPEEKDKWRVTVDGQDRGYIQASDENEARYKAGANEENRRSNSGKVPPAPFIGKTDAWVALAIKRVIKMAADGGYDKVAFISGQQAADLYDLSKQVDRIVVPMVNSDGSRSVRLDPNGGTPIKMMVNDQGVVTWSSPNEFDGKPLSDVVGKEVAERIMNAQPEDVLEGDGLKVGGEGMRTFYDRIVPSVAKDVLRKVGGSTASKSEIVTDKDGWKITPPEETTHGKWMVKSRDYNSKGLRFDTEAEAKAALAEKQERSQQLAFDITEDMLTTLAGGLPLFSERRAPSAPAAAPKKNLPFLRPLDRSENATSSRQPALLTAAREGR